MREFIKFLYEVMYSLIVDIHVLPMGIGAYFLTKLCECRNDSEQLIKLRKRAFVLIGMFFVLKIFMIFFGNEVFGHLMSGL